MAGWHDAPSTPSCHRPARPRSPVPDRWLYGRQFDPRPDTGKDSAARAAAELAAGLAARDLSKVEFAGADSKAVNEQLAALVAGMGSLKPTVQVDRVDVTGSTATAALSFSWTFPGVPKTWTYGTTASLVSEAGRWKSSWQPAIVEPDLDASSRLIQRRLAAKRGDLLGAAGAPIVKLRAVVRIGIDKSNLSADAAKFSAARLARLVGIDAKTYTAKVASAGKAAFVEAIVIRKAAKDRPPNSAVLAIPGALAIEDKQPLAPTRDFARPVIGTVGEATKELVDASKGAVVAGDQVGLAGLQRRYDSKLRGTPGVRVQLIRGQDRRQWIGGLRRRRPGPRSSRGHRSRSSRSPVRRWRRPLTPICRHSPRRFWPRPSRPVRSSP